MIKRTVHYFEQREMFKPVGCDWKSLISFFYSFNLFLRILWLFTLWFLWLCKIQSINSWVKNLWVRTPLSKALWQLWWTLFLLKFVCVSFFQHPEFSFLLKERVCPLIIKLFSPSIKHRVSSSPLEKPLYPVAVRLLRIVSVLIEKFYTLLVRFSFIWFSNAGMLTAKNNQL